MTPWLRYLIAFIIGAHGFTYIPFGLLVPRQMKQWRGTSRLLGRVLDPGQVRTAVPVLHVMAGVVILACAAAVTLAPSAPGWWFPLAILGSVLGIAAFATFWDGQLRYTVAEGGVGLGASIVLLTGALALQAAFGAAL